MQQDILKKKRSTCRDGFLGGDFNEIVSQEDKQMREKKGGELI